MAAPGVTRAIELSTLVEIRLELLYPHTERAQTYCGCAGENTRRLDPVLAGLDDFTGYDVLAGPGAGLALPAGGPDGQLARTRRRRRSSSPEPKLPPATRSTRTTPSSSQRTRSSPTPTSRPRTPPSPGGLRHQLRRPSASRRQAISPVVRGRRLRPRVCVPGARMPRYPSYLLAQAITRSASEAGSHREFEPLSASKRAFRDRAVRPRPRPRW